MTKRSNLPMRLEDIYVEPSSWTMPSGIAFVRFLTPGEMCQPSYDGCILAAENSNGEIVAAFGSVSVALMVLTINGCHIKWGLHRGDDWVNPAHI